MINSKIKSLILDMDGVLWRGYEPIVDLEYVFKIINQMGLNYAFATNNSTKHISEYIEKFDSFNIPVTKEQIFTSGIVTAKELQNRYPQGGSLFVIGTEGLVKTLEDHGFQISKDNCLAVVSGLDFDISYQNLAIASTLIRKGTTFIGTNPDFSFPMPDGFLPGAGSILAFIETASGIKPEIMGKPMDTIFQQALTFLGTQANKTLMIGDRLETDIQGGHNAGCKTALVLSGVANRESGERLKPKPDFISENLLELVKIISNE